MSRRFTVRFPHDPYAVLDQQARESALLGLIVLQLRQIIEGQRHLLGADTARLLSECSRTHRTVPNEVLKAFLSRQPFPTTVSVSGESHDSRKSKHLPIRKVQVLEFASSVRVFRPSQLVYKFYPTIRATYMHTKKLKRQSLLCRTHRFDRVTYQISAREMERLLYLRSRIQECDSEKKGES